MNIKYECMKANGGFYATVDGVEYEFFGGETPDMSISCCVCGKKAEYDEPKDEFTRVVHISSRRDRNGSELDGEILLCTECAKRH